MKTSSPEIRIDHLLRSKRRTIALEIDQQGQLIVRAPRHTPDAEILSLVNAKRGWIIKKQALARQRALEAPPRQFIPGEEFLYLGKTYPLEFVDAGKPHLVLNGAFQMSARKKSAARDVFEKWYRRQAALVIKPRTQTLAEQHGYRPAIIRINGARTRWGSCGPKASLNFTWRLVMAPPQVIDYVIVHELVHLRIRNHSRQYWGTVSRIMPDYKQHLDWLNDSGHLLTID
jgi:predicted metal-dependent hydrolase